MSEKSVEKFLRLLKRSPRGTVFLPAPKAFLRLFPCQRVVALGRIAAAQIEELGVETHCVRHPASGGARLFRRQMESIDL
jgi:hypothetical protein